MKRLIALLLALGMMIVMLTACGQDGNTPAPSGTGDNTSASEGGEEPPAPETGDHVFSFGCIADYTNPIGLDMVNSLNAWISATNEAGGIQIGDEMYTINMIAYDSDSSQTTAATAVERLIYEDQVDYIISDTNIVDSWLHICEENEVVALVSTLGTHLFNPDWSYVYEAGSKNSMGPAIVKWYFEQHPEVRKVFGAYPDSAESEGEMFLRLMECFAPDVEVEMSSYPADSSDLSSLGTKVVAYDPDVFFPVGGGPVLDGSVCKAARQGGFEGDMCSLSPFAAAVILNFLPVENAEGFFDIALPTEIDPPMTETAQAFRDAYTDYYGEWNYPEVVATQVYFGLIAALQEAGTTDKEAVRAVLDNGLEWDGPVGHTRMVSRPDLGNDRTVDSISDYWVKTIHEGEPVLVDGGYLDIEFANKAFEEYIAYLEAQS